MTFEPRRCPIFINCRDRVTDLRVLVAWLELADYERIILLDNDSTYPELLDFYAETPHDVVYLDNLGSRAVWRAGLVPNNEYWVYTDPDVIPIKACPGDVVRFLYELLQIHHHPKAGIGLYLDDLPETFLHLRWEQSLVSPERVVGSYQPLWMSEPTPAISVYNSLVDTSFALYRPGIEHSLPALRTGWPYQARHMPWYRDENPTDEERYYLDRAMKGPFGSSWAQRA